MLGNSSKLTKDQEWIRERVSNVNAKYSTFVACSEVGLELSNESNDESIFCPCHDNTQSPAARYYANSGSEKSHLYCFVCKRRWYGFDIYRQKNRLQFMDALQKLERRFNIAVKSKSGSSEILIRSTEGTSKEWENVDHLLSLIEKKIRNSREKISFPEFIEICKQTDALDWKYKKALTSTDDLRKDLQQVISQLDLILSREILCL